VFDKPTPPARVIPLSEMRAPCLCLDWEVSEQPPTLPQSGFVSAWVLVKQRSIPLGVVIFDLSAGVPPPSELRAALVQWSNYAAQCSDTSSSASTVPARHPPLLTEPPSGDWAPSQNHPRRPPITVIVCTAANPHGLDRCLLSLSQLCYPRYSVLVVDNSPKAHAVDAIVDRHRAELPSVRVVAEPRSGLSWARNLGLCHAQTEWTAWIDDDETADPNWLTELAGAMDYTPEAVAVSGIMLPAELITDAQVWFEQYGGHSKHRGFRRQVFRAGDGQSPLYPLPPFGTGGNMALRRSTVLALGGFDTALGAGTYSHAAEDTQMFSEILLRGGTIAYQPSAITRHTHRPTIRSLKVQLRGYGTGLTAYYTAMAIKNPRYATAIMRLAPRFLAEALGPANLRTSHLPPSFPNSLLWANRQGLARGPFAYLLARPRARWACRVTQRLPKRPR